MHLMGCSCGVAVVDCGVYKGRPATSTEKLVGTLGDEGLERLDTMVVTHFDRDHWEGLPLLASHLQDRPHRSEIKLVYARVPERDLHPGVLYMALLSTWTGSGVRALDLIASLESAKVPIQPITVVEGQRFATDGVEWEAIWPPERLDSRIRDGLKSAVEAVYQLTDDLEAEGYSALRRNLEQAQGSFPDGEGGGEVDGPPPDWEDPEERDDAVARDIEEHPDVGVTHGEVADLELISPKFRARFKATAKRVAAANNELSLVFHDPSGSLIVFGDIQREALEHALLRSRADYEVILAPHHGTVPVPRRFPVARACVSQAGTHHFPYWNRHTGSHVRSQSCVTTARLGTISFP